MSGTFVLELLIVSKLFVHKLFFIWEWFILGFSSVLFLDSRTYGITTRMQFLCLRSAAGCRNCWNDLLALLSYISRPNKDCRFPRINCTPHLC